MRPSRGKGPAGTSTSTSTSTSSSSSAAATASTSAAATTATTAATTTTNDATAATSVGIPGTATEEGSESSSSRGAAAPPQRSSSSEDQPRPYDISIRHALFDLITRKGEVLRCDGVPVNARNKGANSMRLWSDKGRLIAIYLDKGETLIASWLVPKGVTDPRNWIKLARYKGHKIKQYPLVVDLARNRDLVAVFDADKHGTEVRMTVK